MTKNLLADTPGGKEVVLTKMKFIQHDLGYRRNGEMVEIALSGNAVNVRLMDSSNLGSYKQGHRYRIMGFGVYLLFLANWQVASPLLFDYPWADPRVVSDQ